MFSAQLHAIPNALLFLLDFGPFRAVIFTDSLSALQPITSFKCTKCYPVLYGIVFFLSLSLIFAGVNIGFAWVPEHSGMAGNERADRQAQQALRLPDTTSNFKLTISETLNYVKSLLLKLWQTYWVTSEKCRFYNTFNPVVR